MSKNDDLVRSALHSADDVSGRIHKGGYRANLSDVEDLRNHVRKLCTAIERGAAQQGWRLLNDVRMFIEREYADPLAAPDGEWLAKEARPIHDRLCTALANYGATPPAPAPDAGEEHWRDMANAPKNGTLLRLLVKPDDEAHTSFEDSKEPYETIGFNHLQDTCEDVWQFAGWDWSHDCITQGYGEVIGWFPFSVTTPAVLDVDRATKLILTDMRQLLHDYDVSDEAIKGDVEFEQSARVLAETVLSIVPTPTPQPPAGMSKEDVFRIFRPLPEDELSVLREVDPHTWGYPDEDAPQPPAVEAEAVDVISIAMRGYEAWATKPHNKRWAKRIDGTPIPNDLPVNIAMAFGAALKAKTDEIERLTISTAKVEAKVHDLNEMVLRYLSRAEAAEASNKALREVLEWALAYIDGTTMADLRDSARALLSETGATE